MKSEVLQKFSKEDLIEFILRKDRTIELQEKKSKSQKKIGYIFIEGKKYNVIFEKEE